MKNINPLPKFKLEKTRDKDSLILCVNLFFEFSIYSQYIPTVYQMCLSENSLAQSLGLCSSLFAGDTKHCIDSVTETLLKLTD